MPVDRGSGGATPPSLSRLAALWQTGADGPARRAERAAIAGAVFASAHLARLGTTAARAGSAALIALFAALALTRWLTARRARQHARGIVLRTIVATDPDLGHRALRALALVNRTNDEPVYGSAELARLHLSRVLDRAAPDRIEAKAGEESGEGSRGSGFWPGPSRSVP